MERKGLPNKDFLLAQVFFSKKKKCVDVRGVFDGEEAKGKGFYYRAVVSNGKDIFIPYSTIYGKKEVKS